MGLGGSLKKLCLFAGAMLGIVFRSSWLKGIAVFVAPAFSGFHLFHFLFQCLWLAACFSFSFSITPPRRSVGAFLIYFFRSGRDCLSKSWAGQGGGIAGSWRCSLHGCMHLSLIAGLHCVRYDSSLRFGLQLQLGLG